LCIALYGKFAATERQLPYGSTRYYLPPNTNKCARFNRKHTALWPLDLPTSEK